MRAHGSTASITFASTPVPAGQLWLAGTGIANGYSAHWSPAKAQSRRLEPILSLGQSHAFLQSSKHEGRIARTAQTSRFSRLAARLSSVLVFLAWSLPSFGQVSVSPTSLPFGNVAVNNTSTPRNATITNGTAATISITSIGISTGSPFAVASTTCGSTLASRRSCTISVTFAPTTLGAASGTLTVQDSGSPSTLSVSLSGNGVYPVTLSPANHSFGNVTLGNSSAPTTITLRNGQNIPLSIASITVSGSFSQTNNCPISPSTLAAGGTCSISVVFAPSALHTNTGTLTVMHDAFGSPTTANLSGNGTSPVVLSPGSLSFGSIKIGVTSGTKTIQITNMQPQPVALSITSIQTSGDFSQINTCPIAPATLAAGASCPVTVSFAPTAAGTRTGQLLVYDGAVTSPQTANLTGTGVAVLQSIAVSPSTATIAIGQTQQFTATGSYNDGSQRNITTSAAWSSSNTAVARVTGGLATARGNGSATIKASLNGISGTANLTVGAVAPPVITSFSSAANTITAGNSTTLTAVFSGGTGAINNGVGAVTSGTPVTVTPAATTTYMLTVTNSAGSSVTATVTVTVVPAPAITSFTAAAAAITPGNSTTLTGVFSGGNGAIDNGVGSATSGTPVTVTPSTTTTYTLTVTNSVGSSVTSTVTVSVVDGVFSVVGDLDIENHTATLLNNGLVLIAGGYSTASQSPVPAQLYNPANGAFIATGDLNTPRSQHQAILLNNGTVLIIGGVDASGNPTTAMEIYDPVAGTFTGVGHAPANFVANTATLLNNGEVLLAGGTQGTYGNATNTAWIFNPGDNFIVQVGSLNYARHDHTATLLDNGQVLIAGGQDASFNNLATAEIYDPATEQFTLTNSMNNARAFHSANLLNDGTVLLAGCDGSATPSAELFDPVAGTFTLTGSMNYAHCSYTATLLTNEPF